MDRAALIPQIENAIAAHTTWKRRLYTAILTGSCEISSTTACCDDQCAFGHWLYGCGLDAETKKSVSFNEVKQLHAEFHKSAGSVIAYVEREMMSAAQFIMDGEFDLLSEMLLDALTEWKNELVFRDINSVQRGVARVN